MRPITVKNFLILYFSLLMMFLKITKEYTIDYIDPPHVKIENQGNDPIMHITLRFTNSFTLEEKPKQYIILRNNINQYLTCKALEESFQDEEDGNKIVFSLNQQLFWNKTLTYGKFSFLTMNGQAISYEKQTLLIFFNDIKFKNPIHA